MSPDDPRHGSTRGFSAGCRCDDCRLVRNADERTRRKRRDVLGVKRSIDATGTIRRIEALWVMGWTSAAIATRCGYASPNAITELAQPSSRRRIVYAATAAAVAKVYDDLCMTPGPSTQTKGRALRRGCAPPLAWNDIDDPDEQPQGLVEVGDVATQARVDHLERAIEHGHTIDRAAADLGISRNALQTWCSRKDRRDLYDALAARIRPLPAVFDDRRRAA